MKDDINVTAGRKQYDEMHVDGGTVTEMMLYEEAIKPMTATCESG